jgi:hypothetical protein
LLCSRPQPARRSTRALRPDSAIRRPTPRSSRRRSTSSATAASSTPPMA